MAAGGRGVFGEHMSGRKSIENMDMKTGEKESSWPEWFVF